MTYSMTYREIQKHLEEEIDTFVNSWRVNGDTNIICHNIVFGIERILADYELNGRIYDFKVNGNNCKFYDIEILVKSTKISEIYEITPTRFSRIKKLKEINDNRKNISI